MVKDFSKLNVSREDTLKICRVIKRAMKMDPKADAISWEMDLEVVQDATPLDLDRLLAADDFNFAHDVFGIRRHLNRATFQLENCFEPRCGRRGE